MDARECLMTRRSVRKYKPEPVSDELLMEVLEAAMAAPSSVNLQHWYFVVVRTPEAMEELKEIMSRVTTKFTPVLEKRFSRNPETVGKTTSFMNTLGGAPVCVLAFMLKDYPNSHAALLSVAAATENLLLAAWEKGLGSCWLSAPYSMGFGPELRERFAPDKGEFVAAVTLGWPDQEPQMPPRREGRYSFI